MTLGEFRDFTDDLSDDIEMFIFEDEMLKPICVESSGIFDLKDLNEVVESILALSACRHGGAEHVAPMNLN